MYIRKELILPLLSFVHTYSCPGMFSCEANLIHVSQSRPALVLGMFDCLSVSFFAISIFSHDIT